MISWSSLLRGGVGVEEFSQDCAGAVWKWKSKAILNPGAYQVLLLLLGRAGRSTDTGVHLGNGKLSLWWECKPSPQTRPMEKGAGPPSFAGELPKWPSQHGKKPQIANCPTKPQNWRKKPTEKGLPRLWLCMSFRRWYVNVRSNDILELLDEMHSLQWCWLISHSLSRS